MYMYMYIYNGFVHVHDVVSETGGSYKSIIKAPGILLEIYMCILVSHIVMHSCVFE